MYRCVVIDDEIHAIEGIKKYMESVQELELLRYYTDPLLALKELKAGDPVDLIFMDVDMPKITGIELAQEIRNKTDKLIFTTAHTKYAFEAFEVNADAYLLKPYSLGKFVITINKLFPTTAHNKKDTDKHDFFFVKSKEDNLKIVKVKYDEIIAVESKLNYILIHTTKKNVLTYMSLTEINKTLTDYGGFIQVQRSFIAGVNHIKYIDGNQLEMNNGIAITVGVQYREHFAEFVAQNMFKVKA